MPGSRSAAKVYPQVTEDRASQTLCHSWALKAGREGNPLGPLSSQVGPSVARVPEPSYVVPTVAINYYDLSFKFFSQPQEMCYFISNLCHGICLHISFSTLGWPILRARCPLGWSEAGSPVPEPAPCWIILGATSQLIPNKDKK